VIASWKRLLGGTFRRYVTFPAHIPTPSHPGVATGTYVIASDLTVEQACAQWLAGRHSIRPTTRAAYEHVGVAAPPEAPGGRPAAGGQSSLFD